MLAGLKPSSGDIVIVQLDDSINERLNLPDVLSQQLCRTWAVSRYHGRRYAFVEQHCFLAPPQFGIGDATKAHELGSGIAHDIPCRWMAR